MNLLLTCLASVMLALVLGTLFSFTYPNVEIDAALAFLLVLVNLFIVLVFRRSRQTNRSDRR